MSMDALSELLNAAEAYGDTRDPSGDGDYYAAKAMKGLFIAAWLHMSREERRRLFATHMVKALLEYTEHQNEYWESREDMQRAASRLTPPSFPDDPRYFEDEQEDERGNW